jgi:hypothetical protein
LGYDPLAQRTTSLTSLINCIKIEQRSGQKVDTHLLVELVCHFTVGVKVHDTRNEFLLPNDLLSIFPAVDPISQDGANGFHG